MEKSFSKSDKKQLSQDITAITNKKLHIKIFKLIQNNNITFTKNKNEVFFNLDILDDETLFNIKELILKFRRKNLLKNSESSEMNSQDNY